mmetsp:Transcript_11919/g.51104  ORF Transcript_11919/g.51104 Transcript_11919/m.51104 type:complete len:275 (+) Transcript_11919:586-1410(+)
MRGFAYSVTSVPPVAPRRVSAGAASRASLAVNRARASAAAAAAPASGEFGLDVQAGHSLEPHHADGLLEDAGQAGAPQDLQRVPVGVLHELRLAPAHLAAGAVVEAHPRDVRLLLGARVHARERLRDRVRGVRVHGGGRVGDGQVPELPGEKLLVRRQEQQPLARLPRARRAPQPVDVLLLGRGQTYLDDHRDVGEVHAARGDVGGHHHRGDGVPELIRGFRPVPLALPRVDFKHGLPERDEELGGELRGARGGEETNNLVVRHLRLVAGDELH